MLEPEQQKTYHDVWVALHYLYRPAARTEATFQNSPWRPIVGKDQATVKESLQGVVLIAQPLDLVLWVKNSAVSMSLTQKWDRKRANFVNRRKVRSVVYSVLLKVPIVVCHGLEKLFQGDHLSLPVGTRRWVNSRSRESPGTTATGICLTCSTLRRMFFRLAVVVDLKASKTVDALRDQRWLSKDREEARYSSFSLAGRTL